MNTEQIIKEIDVEIQKLQQARALLNGAEVRKSAGNPKQSVVAERIFAVKPARRKMSAETRARMAAGQQARWAKSKKAAKKAPAKA